jgi:hypothetical protein
MKRPDILKKGSPRTIEYMAYIRSRPRDPNKVKSKKGKGFIDDVRNMGKSLVKKVIDESPMPNMLKPIANKMTDNIIDNQRLVGNKIKFGSALRMAGY